MRKIGLVGLVLTLAVACGGCRQACSAWESTRAGVCGAFSEPRKLDNPCPGDTRAPVMTEPVYDSWCASEARVGGPSYSYP